MANRKNNQKPKKGRLDKYKPWQIVATLVVGAIVLIAIFHIIVEPRLEVWIVKNWLPQAYSVQQLLQTKYPDNQISVNDQTYINGNSRERSLIVTFTGKIYPDTAEKSMVEQDICSALGQNAQQYNRFVLQTGIQHNYLVFYYRETQSEAFTCNAGP